MKHRKLPTRSSQTVNADVATSDVDAVVARLKEELDVEATDLSRSGMEHGEVWARDVASFVELRALEELRYETISFFDLARQFESINVECPDREELEALKSADVLAEAFGAGFIAGALSVLDAVKPRLEVSK